MYKSNKRIIRIEIYTMYKNRIEREREREANFLSRII